LVLVSQSIIGQWEKELQKSNLKYAVVISNKDVEKLNVEENDVVLVSPSFYNKIIAMNSMFAWKRFIFDEPGNLRIAGMSHVKACFYWFITASWLNLVFSNGAYFNVTSVYSPLQDTPQSIIERVGKLHIGSNVLTISGCRHLNIVRRMCGIATSNSSVSLNAAGSQSVRLILHSSEEFIKKSFNKPTITHTNILCLLIISEYSKKILLCTIICTMCTSSIC
jgi:hypothetical protein